jgi:hypothetical protein
MVLMFSRALWHHFRSEGTMVMEEEDEVAAEMLLKRLKRDELCWLKMIHAVLICLLRRG